MLGLLILLKVRLCMRAPNSEKQSSLRERKRKHVVKIDHQLLDYGEVDSINIVFEYEKI